MVVRNCGDRGSVEVERPAQTFTVQDPPPLPATLLGTGKRCRRMRKVFRINRAATRRLNGASNVLVSLKVMTSCLILCADNLERHVKKVFLWEPSNEIHMIQRGMWLHDRMWERG